MGEVYKTTFSTETEKNTILRRFCVRFTHHLNHVGDLWLTLGARGRLFFVLFRVDVSISFFMDFGLPAGSSKKGSAARWLGPLGVW